MSSSASAGRDVAKVVIAIAFIVAALAFYFVRLGHTGISLITSGEAVSIVFGIGVFLLPLVGVWIVYATLRAGWTISDCPGVSTKRASTSTSAIFREWRRVVSSVTPRTNCSSR